MVHGPFPIRISRLLVGLMLLPLSSVLLLMVAVPSTLRCDPVAGICQVEQALQEVLEFPHSNLRSVRVEDVTGSKGRRYGRPVLVLARGELALSLVKPAQAQTWASEVNASLRSGAAFEATLHRPWLLVLVVAAVVAMGLGLVATALRGIGRYRIDAGANALLVQRSILGVPTSRETVSTVGVRDVELDWGRDKDLLHGRHHLGDAQARLVLVTADGVRRPLSARKHRGYTLHLRAAQELRTLLGCPVRADERAELFKPALVSRGMRFALAWTGICCGSLAGLAAYGAVALTLGGATLQSTLGESAPFAAAGGAIAGMLLMLYLSHPRPPR